MENGNAYNSAARYDIGTKFGRQVDMAFATDDVVAWQTGSKNRLRQPYLKLSGSSFNSVSDGDICLKFGVWVPCNHPNAAKRQKPKPEVELRCADPFIWKMEMLITQPPITI